jgi:probable rRNA maturation factor
MDDHSVDVSFSENLELPLSPERIEAAVLFVLRSETVPAAELSLALVGDEEIAEMNDEYLSHEGPTDVISFELERPDGAPLGDIYIGAQQAERQAEELGVPFEEELLRLAMHGTLHVLGYDHPEGEDRADSEMYRRQEALLAAFLAGGEPVIR